MSYTRLFSAPSPLYSFVLCLFFMNMPSNLFLSLDRPYQYFAISSYKYFIVSTIGPQTAQAKHIQAKYFLPKNSICYLN